MSSSVFMIAEPGCTHEGRLEDMLRLVGVSADAGCDCYKSQWTSNAERMAQRRHAPEYLKYYKWLEFPIDWHAILRDKCLELGMEYACTSYIADDVAKVEPFVSVHKISSFETADVALITACRATGKRTLISTGLLDSDGYEDLLQKTTRWNPEWHPEFLLCVSAYPAPADQMNLMNLRGCDECGRDYDGLSDHSRHLLTGAVAVGGGATIIEAHICLEDTDPSNPDYAVAFSPSEFSRYIENIRYAETMMGDGVKHIQPSEQPMLRYKVTA